MIFVIVPVISVFLNSGIGKLLFEYRLGVCALNQHLIAGWDQFFIQPISQLYTLSLLHTLVSRKALRDLLNRNLTAQGVGRLDSQASRISKQSHPVNISMVQETATQTSAYLPEKRSINRDPSRRAADPEIALWELQSSSIAHLDQKEGDEVHGSAESLSAGQTRVRDEHVGSMAALPYEVSSMIEGAARH